ncbi:MAG: LamG-like jellyroll fold domain-containing protein [Ferruginibacter sp.]
MKFALRTLTAFIILQLLIGAQLMAQDKTALNLDGINDYVSFSTTLANNSDQTIEFWLKLDAVPATGSKVLVYNGSTSTNGYGLTLTDGKISLLIGGVALRNTTYNPVAGEWVHYALVRSSAANWTVYVNGNNYGNFTYSANAPTGFFKISQAGEQFADSIDGLRVWKTARYATEISGSRYCWVNPFNTSITNDYYFSDGTIGGNNTLVTTLFDQAGSVNGTLQNFALTGATSNFAAGVFQFQTTGNLYVKANATGTNTGESWDNAFTSLQTALDAAEGLSNCGIFNIWVAGGTYLPARDIFGQSNPADPRDKTFFLNSSTSVYGGFAGNETSLAQRTKAVIADNPTILSGDPGTPGSTTDNAYHVLLSVSGSDDGYSPVTDGFIISNGNASGAGGITSETGFFVSRGQGGAMYSIAAKRTFINCIFSNNSASGKGGGICSDNSIFSISSCIFSGNHAGGNGGGMYNTAATTAISIQNSSFTGNTAVNGGGFANEGTDAFSITNCLFWTNTGTGIGGAIYNIGQNNKVTNSILYTNAGGSRLGATVNITYSIVEGELQAGEGNSNINPQFLNTGDPDGPDNEWMTADDGLQLSSCSPAIDKGTNNAVIGTTDIAWQPRKNNVPFITDAGNGTAPLIDLGPYENQSNFTIAQISGSITGTHTIPYPQELTPDLLQSVSAPAAIPGLTISWEKNEENNGWVVTTPAAATAQYPLPELTKNTLFRRVVTVCGTTYYSNIVSIKVIKPNGAISGRVLSSNGTPVEGIKIYVQKKTSSLPGSPLNHRDSATTGADGSYTVSPLYYGDPDTIPAPATQFIVMPVKANHAFNFDTLTRSLTNIIPQVSNVDFIDKTVLSITGKTYQECVGCVNENGQPQTIVCPLDSVDMYKNDSYFTKTGQIEQGGEYGSYAATVTDPGTYKIEPRFKNHVFEPVFTNVAVTQNVADINFKDVSTHTISGKLTAGCNDYIGTAVLEFSDIIPNDADGNPRTGCFRKRVTTNPGSGTYSIVLPARKYAVRLISFTPKAGGNVNSPDLLAFFNTTVPKDSLVRDVTIANDSLDLIYQRAPVIQLIGLDNVCLAKPVATNSFTVMQQGIEKTFTIKVYQGPVVNNFGCPVTDTTGTLFTNIQGDDINDTLIYRTTNGTAQLTLKGGIPNIVAPYYKTFFLQFKDVYGRTATASKNVVVKGIKTNTGTFTTVSPELPLMVLHDPPGDNSSSFWSTSSTAETALRFLAAENNNVNIWGEVKIGATFEAGIGVSTENSVWGSINPHCSTPPSTVKF